MKKMLFLFGAFAGFAFAADITPSDVFYIRTSVLTRLDFHGTTFWSSSTPDVKAYWQEPMCSLQADASKDQIIEAESGALFKVTDCKEMSESGEQQTPFTSETDCKSREKLAGQCDEKFDWKAKQRGLACTAEIVEGKLKGTRTKLNCGIVLMKKASANRPFSIETIQKAVGDNGAVSISPPQIPAGLDQSFLGRKRIRLSLKKKRTISFNENFVVRTFEKEGLKESGLFSACALLPESSDKTVIVNPKSIYETAGCEESINKASRSNVPDEATCLKRAEISGDCEGKSTQPETPGYIWARKGHDVICLLRDRKKLSQNLTLRCHFPVFKNETVPTQLSFDRLKRLLGDEVKLTSK